MWIRCAGDEGTLEGSGARIELLIIFLPSWRVCYFVCIYIHGRYLGDDKSINSPFTVYLLILSHVVVKLADDLSAHIYAHPKRSHPMCLAFSDTLLVCPICSYKRGFALYSGTFCSPFASPFFACDSSFPRSFSSSSISARYFSASRAAMQPDPTVDSQHGPFEIKSNGW